MDRPTFFVLPPFPGRFDRARDCLLKEQDADSEFAGLGVFRLMEKDRVGAN